MYIYIYIYVYMFIYTLLSLIYPYIHSKYGHNLLPVITTIYIIDPVTSSLQTVANVN